MNKIVAILLCVAVAFALFACRETNAGVNEISNQTAVQAVSDYALETVKIKDDGNSGYETADAADPPEIPGSTPVELTIGYSSLTTDGQRQCYDELCENVYYISEDADGGVYNTLRVTLYGTVLSEAELRLVIVAFNLDHPEVFWLDNKFGYSNSYNNTVLELYSFLSADEITRSQTKLYSETKSMLSSLPEGLDDYSRELYVHNALVDACEYASDVRSISDDFLSFSSYGAIVNKSAVCEGYTRALQLLLSLVGIDSCPIIGNGNDGLHMWSTVKIDKEWYYVDPTWNDSKTARYDYFNITSEQLLADHTIASLYSQLTEEMICGDSDNAATSFNVFVPICSATEENYFVHNSVPVVDLNEDAKTRIENALQTALSDNSDCIYLRIDPAGDYTRVLDGLFYSGDYLFFGCVDSVNQQSTGKKIDRDNVSIMKKQNISVVTVYLKYTEG